MPVLASGHGACCRNNFRPHGAGLHVQQALCSVCLQHLMHGSHVQVHGIARKLLTAHGVPPPAHRHLLPRSAGLVEEFLNVCDGARPVNGGDRSGIELAVNVVE